MKKVNKTQVAIKAISNEVKAINEQRRSAAEVIRLAKKTDGYIIANLLGLQTNEVASIDEASNSAIREAVNAYYPFKCNGRNMQPRTAYLWIDGRVVVAKRYVEVPDYLQAMARAARAKVKQQAQKNINDTVYYVAPATVGEVTEIPLKDAEVATYADYKKQQLADALGKQNEQAEG